MRIIFFFAAFLAVFAASYPASAQVDIKKLGKPLGWDDSVNMKDRLVYFDEGVATKNAPLDLPIISDDEAQDFASLSVPLALTMSYLNHKEKLAAAQPYFTENGWKEYSDMIGRVKLIDVLVKQYYSLSSAAKQRPLIKEKGVNSADGSYYWIIDVPLMLVYTRNVSGNGKDLPFEMSIEIVIKRVPSGPTSHNVKIDKWSIVS